MDDEIRYPIASNVVWVTPAGASNNHTPWVGVHFPDYETGRRLRQRIEELPGTALGSARATHTI